MTMGGRMKLRLILLVALLALPSVVSGQQTAAESGGIQPGDKVTITVWQRDELSGDFTVAPDGSLNHPLYRAVKVTVCQLFKSKSDFEAFSTPMRPIPRWWCSPTIRWQSRGR